MIDTLNTGLHSIDGLPGLWVYGSEQNTVTYSYNLLVLLFILQETCIDHTQIGINLYLGLNVLN